MNGVQDFFSIFFPSAKKCEMTSVCMTSLHVDLNEAAKCVDIIPLTFFRTLVQNGKWRRYLAYLTEIDQTVCESWYKNLERTHDWCSAIGKVAF